MPLLPQLCAELGLLPGLSLSAYVVVVLQRISIPLLSPDTPCEINLDGSAIQQADISLFPLSNWKTRAKGIIPFPWPLLVESPVTSVTKQPKE